MAPPPAITAATGFGAIGSGSFPERRGTTARDLLKIQWDYAVATNADRPSAGTSVKAARLALPADEAFKRLAGKDPRPLLVVRECQVCNKTDNALLRPGIDNEKTIVLSHFFHCVKLPVDVVDPDEPFNALFPTNDAEHLFVSSTDGTNRIPLESDTSRPELWAAMGKILSRSYTRDPSTAANEILKAHDKLDLLDQKLADLSKERDGLAENAGKLDKDKLKKVDREIESTKKELDAEKASIQKLSKIDLKTEKKA